MGIKQEHSIGEIRYLTYQLIFPGDNEVWTDQLPFVENVQSYLKKTRWKNDPTATRNLLVKGEHHFKDHNGVTHRVLIETTQRPKVWGKRRRR